MSLWRVQAACLGRRGDGTGRGGAARRPGRGVRTRPRPGAVAQRGGQTEQQQQGSGQDEPGAHGAHLASGPGPGAAWWWPEARRAAAAWRRREPAPPWPVARPPTGRWRRRRRGGRAAGAAARCPAAAPAAWQHAEQGRTQRSGQPRRTRWVGHDRRQRLPRLAGAERGHSFHREVQGRGQRPQVGRRRRAPGRWPGSRPGGRPPAGAPRPGCPAAQGRAARPGRSAAAPPARPAHAATARRPAHHQQRPAVLHEHVVQHHRAGMAEPGATPASFANAAPGPVPGAIVARSVLPEERHETAPVAPVDLVRRPEDWRVNAAQRPTASSAGSARPCAARCWWCCEEGCPAARPAPAAASSSGRHDEAVAHARFGDKQLGHGWVVELAAKAGYMVPEISALVLGPGPPEALGKEAGGA